MINYVIYNNNNTIFPIQLLKNITICLFISYDVTWIYVSYGINKKCNSVRRKSSVCYKYLLFIPEALDEAELKTDINIVKLTNVSDDVHKNKYRV